jgi:hypothetical protein
LGPKETMTRGKMMTQEMMMKAKVKRKKKRRRKSEFYTNEIMPVEMNSSPS